MKPTSLLAYNAIKANGLLRGLQFMVYEVLAEFHPSPLTASEVADHIRGHRINSINPRFAELQRKGVIRAAGERRCAVTGRQTVAWEITDQLPAKAELKLPGRTNALRRDLESAIGKLESLEQNCKLLLTENAALKAKLRNWGRPKTAARLEKKIATEATMQDLPCIIPVNVVDNKSECDRLQDEGAESGPRQAGDGGPCGRIFTDRQWPVRTGHAPENGGDGGADAGHGGGIA